MTSEGANYDTANDTAFRKYLSALRGQVGEAKYKSWFLDLGLAERTQKSVTLSTPSESKRDILDNRYLPMLIELWRREIGPVEKFKLTVRAASLSASAAKAANAATRVESGLFDNGANGAGGAVAAAAPAAKSGPSLAAPLDPRRSFDTLAVGDSNRVAVTSVKQAIRAGAPSELVYLYGESGVGKTHLLQAGCSAVVQDAERSALYVTYRNLINACVNAALTNKTSDLHAMFLANDVVAIDDVHFLDGKERTQQELLIVIDALIDSGKSIIIAGDRSPAKLSEAGIHERLADRLAGGLSTQIYLPDEEMRREILSRRVAGHDGRCRISPDVTDFVARHFANSTREAIGALNQVLLMYRNEDRLVSLEDARDLLDQRLRDHRRAKAATLEDAIYAGAEAFGLTTADIVGRAQPQRIVRARHAIVYCARSVLSESFPRIGRALSRDHTTVMSSFRRAEALLERDRAFQEAVRRIREALES